MVTAREGVRRANEELGSVQGVQRRDTRAAGKACRREAGAKALRGMGHQT